MTGVGREFDLVVIGGGINGTGIARDAAGRGLSVLLCESGDLAEATSSASTKLIHGGLRYLEHYEFRLVREALKEREVLLRAAPHIVSPLTFILPYERHLRPRWMIRAGLFLYDNLARRDRLEGSHSVDLISHPAGAALKGAPSGFSYSDCWVDDARLVILNAMDARARGATILTRTPFVSSRRSSTGWRAKIRHQGKEIEIGARVLVNAAGPWVRTVLQNIEGGPRSRDLRLIKGSHIVINRQLPSDDAYIFQNPDGRIVFAIPYQVRLCLIGTTDAPYEGDPAAVTIDEEEVDYLIGAVNHYLAEPVGREDIAWTYSGVRPLYDDGSEDASAVTRDYAFDIDGDKDKAPLLSVLGGKITTYRRLAEHVMERLAPFLRSGGSPWTRNAILPGGDLPTNDPEEYAADLVARHPWLPRKLARRFASSYGTLSETIISDARALAGLGKEVASDLYEAELRYLVEKEWARTAKDILWRRTKLGLNMPAAERAAVENWVNAATASDGGVRVSVTSSR